MLAGTSHRLPQEPTQFIVAQDQPQQILPCCCELLEFLDLPPPKGGSLLRFFVDCAAQLTIEDPLSLGKRLAQLVQFSYLALCHHPRDSRPDVVFDYPVVSPISRDVVLSDGPPTLELTERHGHGARRQSKVVAELPGRQRLGREVESSPDTAEVLPKAPKRHDAPHGVGDKLFRLGGGRHERHRTVCKTITPDRPSDQPEPRVANRTRSLSSTALKLATASDVPMTYTRAQ